MKCLGLSPTNSAVEIEDGYMRIAYNFKTKPADKRCLFEVFEDDETKFDRWSKEAAKKNLNDITNILGKAKDNLQNKYKKILSAKDLFA
jgi:hypothetical protein